MLRNVIQAIESMDAQEISQSLQEKRRALRVRSYARAQIHVQGGESYKAVIIELGLDGLRLKSMDAPLQVGQALEVCYALPPEGAEAGPVKAQICWVNKVGRDTIVGCKYADSRENMRRSWVRFLLQELGFDESRLFQRRKFIRVDAAIPARLIDGEGRSLCEARVVNIGIGGALLETTGGLEKGLSLDLELSLWRILPTLRLPIAVIDTRLEAESGLHLTSVKFGAIGSDQVKVLGNYIINMINQTAET